MKATEHRLGNLIYSPIQKEVVTLVAIEQGNRPITLGKMGTSSFSGFDCLEPILLTEEWHNNFGVKRNGFNSFEYKIQNKFNFHLTVIFTGDYVMIRQGEKKSIGCDIISVWNKDLIKRNMYVHEWQNLYFLLAGEELYISWEK